MRKVIIFIILVLGISTLYSQTDDQKAFQTYKKAREAFQNKNYESSSQLLLETKRLFGKANIRIQPMLIKSLVGIEDWRQARIEVTDYLQLNPNQELIEYQEIKKTEKNIDNKIIEEDQLFSSAKSTKSVLKYKNYLEKFPYGKYKEEAKKLLLTQNDENAWNQAKEKSSTVAYYEYLNNYPNGDFAISARSTISRWDNKAYEKAIAEGTQDALNYYLKYYPKGEYQNEVSKKLTDRIEYDVYKYATNNSSIDNYETYVRKYPNGKYAYEANKTIENTYYKFGNNSYASKNYRNAKAYYETYISKFSNGTYNVEVRKKINKCRRKLNQRSASFLMYTYDKQSSIGISFGDLNKNSLGYYVNLKMNQGIFKSYDALWKIDNLGNSDSPWSLQPTGVIKKANIAISGGVTFLIAYPLWGYLGGGYGYYSQYEEINEYTSSGSLHEVVWMRNTDESYSKIFPEGGLVLKVSNLLTLKYGIMYQSELIHQFGVGFQI